MKRAEQGGANLTTKQTRKVEYRTVDRTIERLQFGEMRSNECSDRRKTEQRRKE